MDEMGYRRHHLEDLRKPNGEGAPPLPPKKHHVDSYIGIFRPPDASLSVKSEDGTKAAEFGTSALASYVILRNNLCLHEEAIRQKRTTFTFSNSDPNGLKSSQTSYAPSPPSYLLGWTNLRGHDHHDRHDDNNDDDDGHHHHNDTLQLTLTLTLGTAGYIVSVRVSCNVWLWWWWPSSSSSLSSWWSWCSW